MVPRALGARVAYVPGTGFYADGEGRGNMRLNFSFAHRTGSARASAGSPAWWSRSSSLRAVFGEGAVGGARGFDAPPDWTDRRGRAGMTGARRAMVLAGGLSYEREVSLKSGRRVLDALRTAGVEAEIRDADLTLLPTLAVDPPDAIVIALHGAAGEDGSLRGVLDLCEVPYVGADARAARLAWDKPSAKAVLRERGIPTPDWVALPHERFSELGAVAVLDRIVARLGMPLMVKPAQGGSGSRRGGGARRRRAARGDGRLLLVRPRRRWWSVRAGQGRGGLRRGPRRRAAALPPVEIVPRTACTTTRPATPPGSTTWHTPARLTPEVADRVAETALAAHARSGCATCPGWT